MSSVVLHPDFVFMGKASSLQLPGIPADNSYCCVTHWELEMQMPHSR